MFFRRYSDPFNISIFNGIKTPGLNCYAFACDRVSDHQQLAVPGGKKISLIKDKLADYLMAFNAFNDPLNLLKRLINHFEDLKDIIVNRTTEELVEKNKRINKSFKGGLFGNILLMLF